jgi:protein-tyrosine phosphatase
MHVSFRSVDLTKLIPGIDSSSSLPGTLWLHSMPARRDDESWEDFMTAARVARIETILCLCSRDEVKSKSPAYAKALKEPDFLEGIAVREFTITDFKIPNDEAGFINFVRQAAEDLRAGRRLLLHCGAGIGRTGLTAACILSALGIEGGDADMAVAAAGAGAETQEQQTFLARIRSALG